MHVLDGRAAATFVVLAGVGLTLRSRRAVAADDPRAIAPVRATLIRRGLFLLAMGFVNLVIWPGDILRVYGVSLIVAAGLITASDRRLLAAALAFILGFVALLLVVDYETNWDWSTMTYHRLWTLKGPSATSSMTASAACSPGPGCCSSACGWAVATCGTARSIRGSSWPPWPRRCSPSWSPGGASRYFRASPRDGRRDDQGPLRHGLDAAPAAVPAVERRGGGRGDRAVRPRGRGVAGGPVARALAAMGQMALTWYVLHIVLGLGSIVALGLATSQPLPVGQACGLLFFSAAVLISWLWKRRFRHGPLEWVMRRVAG